MTKGITQQDLKRIARMFEGGCEGQESFFAEDELVDSGSAQGVWPDPTRAFRVDPDEMLVPRRRARQRRLQY
jgi:hypothetical protein